jgi:hypothetical protein
MKPEIPFNPFTASEEFLSRDPETMSPEEIEILLYSKRLAIKLDMERLYKKANTSKFIMDLAKSLGIPELIEKFIDDVTNPVQQKKSDKS